MRILFFLTSFLLIGHLFSMPSKTNKILTIKHGMSFGECIGYCYMETTYTKDSIKQVFKSWNNEKPDSIATQVMDEKIWKSMIHSIDVKEFYKLPNKMGCSDCSDGGAEWLTIETKNKKRKVEFGYGRENSTVESLLIIIRKFD